MTSKARRGVYAAAVTPLAADGRADLAKLARYCERLIADGLDGVAPTGTTGEGTSVAMASTMNSLPHPRTASPISDIGFKMPVVVSQWTAATWPIEGSSSNTVATFCGETR